MVDSDVSVARLLALLAALASMAGCEDCGTDARSMSGGETKATAARTDDMTWERAEIIARQQVAAEGWREGGADRYQRSPRVKYFFKYMHLRVLVHRGEAVPSKQGGSALARFLWDIPEADREALRAEDLQDLLEYFDALPPIKERSPWSYYDGSTLHPFGPGHPLILPHAEWSGQRGLLRLYFNVSSDGGQNISDDFPRTMAEWTLTLSSDGKGAWSERERHYSLTQKQFVE